MAIDRQQLEMNVNLHSLQPTFLNCELHYIIASSDNQFRFVNWQEKPGNGEEKFYCFLVDNPMHIPAGDVHLKESYQLTTEPIYPIVAGAADLIKLAQNLQGSSKAIRHFTDEAIDGFENDLRAAYQQVERHLVKSPEFQHLLFVLPEVEISISSNMVYLKQKVQITEQHYQHIKEEKAQME